METAEGVISHHIQNFLTRYRGMMKWLMREHILLSFQIYNLPKRRLYFNSVNIDITRKPMHIYKKLRGDKYLDKANL